MKAIVITAALSSLFAVSAASAEPIVAKPAAEAQVEKVAATPAKRDAKTLYCYELESTGTRITKRSCRTRSDWKAVGVTVPANL
ncbi:hypothetical protein [Sphingomonas adhaesiva]|uniref:hypothetical protein n=1 Tax=Sphingomonas adhaesiva TaxID=28212 RepID=UPI002FF8DBAE